MTLNEAQLEAVNARDRRLLVLAAPGSGKTRVLVERMVRILDGPYHPSEVLALTFTRKAAAEMRERLADRLSRPDSFWRALHVSTFHGWCCKVLRTYAERLGMVENFTIRDEADGDDLILYSGRELGKAPPEGVKPKTGQWAKPARLWKEEDVRRTYYKLLREANAVDYDGLELLMLKLLQMPDVAESLRMQRIHVLVDEGQDTSAIQQQILDALNPQHLFVVGDHAQSIYAFRGANVDGFVGLGERPAWRTIELPTNYRSLPEIVAAASRVGRAMKVPGLAQDCGREPLGPPGWVEPLAQLIGYEDATVWDMQTVHEAGGIPWSQMAVLAPKWALVHELAAALEQAGIPHTVARKAGAVWDTETARWAINCLRVAVNPRDHVALFAALNAFTPRIRMGEWAGMRSRALRAESSILIEAAENTGPTLSLCIAIDRASYAVHESDGWPLSADALIAALRAELERLHLTHRVAELADVERAICAWGDARAAEGHPFRVVELLDWYSGRHVGEDTEKPATPEAVDRVTLTTIHGAKGLEWRAVWVLGCEEGVLPRAADSEEERRAFYVALTRATDRVRLCWRRSGIRSRFVGEALPPEEERPPPTEDDLSACPF